MIRTDFPFNLGSVVDRYDGVLFISICDRLESDLFMAVMELPCPLNDGLVHGNSKRPVARSLLWKQLAAAVFCMPSGRVNETKRDCFRIGNRIEFQICFRFFA
jgi:hypothetical protein